MRAEDVSYKADEVVAYPKASSEDVRSEIERIP